MEKLFHFIESHSNYKNVFEYFIDNRHLIAYHFFSMTREYYIDIFGIRLGNNDDNGIVIEGFRETYTAVKSTDINEVLSHGLTVGERTILVYTDASVTHLFGVVETNEVTSIQPD